MHRGNKDDAGSSGEVVSHSVSEAPEEVLAYWTPERMAEAVPRDIRLPDPKEGESQAEGK
ncbi:hypothetical protein ARGLB_065_00080 [Arthrobacter globiformis NBRC 12137]|uniref:Uncharacterized protein n=1 Tax=Arthrobacter globiformis (strain ATCC 8010 / DSM 20124 / JCM 1332 / NBRC 12137 / NCIMB 8907 / NRRL B-2979 / 168) TaxID=1077972 RepID=H0QNG8_ARTG1|nr:hypothetical protein ARGLB_065_00080 [Arthrobacter globiformis NBRC 12137]